MNVIKPNILSERETEILISIANGNTNKEIGNSLCISYRTVETHRRNIIEKLNVRNTAEMVKTAINNHLIV